jgi:TetR/AcrR family transcriptional repressor of nem operon
MNATGEEKLLNAGEKLLLADGYSRTSVDSVCTEAGVTKGSFYHYFKTKEDLGVRVLERWINRTASTLEAGPHQNISDPIQAVLVYVEHVADSVDTLWGSGCLVGNLSMDLASSSERMQHSVEKIFRGFVDQHAEMFKSIIIAVDNPKLPSAEGLAELFLSTIEGSIVIGKAYRKKAPVENAMRNFKSILEYLLNSTS